MGKQDERFQQFAHILLSIDKGASLLRYWPLHGGVSAQVMAVAYQQSDGTIARCVVRRHGDIDYGLNPAIAADEFALLSLLRDKNIPVPTPLYYGDGEGLLDRPVICSSFEEGTLWTESMLPLPMVEQLANTLAQIHAVPFEALRLPSIFRRANHAIYGQKDELDDTLQEGLIREVLAVHWPPHRDEETVLLHGDYWPGNILWKDQRLQAVLDWEDSCTGSPLADLAGARMELFWTYGEEAMIQFTQSYLSRTGRQATTLPLWDLVAALKPASQIALWADGSATREATMRAVHARFVAQVLEKLG